MKNNISVILEVYNESDRLEECLRSFQWADELVVFVKSSNDNTLDIAKKYATHVYEVPFCQASENIVNNSKLHETKEWCFYITASSKIDPELVPYIINLTSDNNFNYDVIGLPYQMSVLNIIGNQSPWGSDFKFLLIRKSKLILSTKLHCEINFDTKLIYKLKNSKGKFYHYTHRNPDDFFHKHIRYVKYEAEYYVKTFGTNSFKKAFIMFLRSIAFVTIKKRTIFKGKNGMTLSLGYISYYIMLLIFVWFLNSKVETE